MNGSSVSPLRLVIAAVVAAAILWALLVATGSQTLSGPSSSASITVEPATAPPAPTAPPAGAVKGSVGVVVKHLTGSTWRFRYTVRSIGKTPIGGFQLGGTTARLFHIVGPPWNYYGSGVCGKGGSNDLLIYWSTNQTSGSLIRPGTSRTFSFDVKTAGPTTLSYALSFGTATPQFGKIQGPQSSTLSCP